MASEILVGKQCWGTLVFQPIQREKTSLTSRELSLLRQQKTVLGIKTMV